jgi:acetate kinase
VNNLDYSIDEVNNILLRDSGMTGLTGHSDLRDIEKLAAQGNEDCKLALDMSAYRIKQYIGKYVAVLNGLDAIIFTAGVGENSIVLRKLICEEMEFFGIEIDEEKNNVKARKLTEIHSEKSKVKIVVIPTNEELEIAKQSFQLLN